jgi:DNA-binding NarL/FixJ family response regulator
MSTEALHKVMVVDDHPVVRHGMVQLLEQQSNLTVCAETGNACTAMKLIPEVNPDVIMLDISLGDCNGVSVIKDIRARFGDIPILVLSMHDETLYAERVLRVGGNGYIMKEEAATDLIAAINRVLRGEVHLSEKMTTRLLKPMMKNTHNGHDEDPPAISPVQCLSDRELEVFELIGHGMKTRAVAQKLHLSVKTIEAHRANIKNKLNLGNAIELLQLATWHVQGNTDDIAAFVKSEP